MTTTGGELDGAMHSVWLHGNWRWLTQNMTTPQREAAADAVDRYSAILMAGADEEPARTDRWWAEATQISDSRFANHE